MKRFLVAVAVALAGSTASADVVNGSFELGTPSDGPATHWTRLIPGDASLAGWSIVSGNVDWFSAEAAQACAGSRSLELNGNTNGAVSQTFATTPGQRYRVTFCLAGNPNGPPSLKKLEVSASGSPHRTYGFDTTGRTLTDMGWAAQSYSFTASGAIDHARLSQLHDPRRRRPQRLRPGDRQRGRAGGPDPAAGVGPVVDTGRVRLGHRGAAARRHPVHPMFVYGSDNKPTWFVGVG